LFRSASVNLQGLSWSMTTYRNSAMCCLSSGSTRLTSRVSSSRFLFLCSMTSSSEDPVTTPGFLQK